MSRSSCTFAYAIIFALSFLGCGDDDSTGDPDAGGAQVPPETQMALSTLLEGSAAAAALGGPLLPETEMLRDDSRLGAMDTREMAAQDRVEMGVSGNSVVTDPMCVAYAWTELTCAITFDNCTLEATGETIDGGLSLGVTFAPTEIAFSFTTLQIGDTTIDGMVGLRTGGNCPTGMDTCMNCRDTDPACLEMRAPQQTLYADLSIHVGEDVALVLDDGTVDHDETSTTISGAGTLMSPSFTGTYTATALRWAMGDCLPTSGTVVLTAPGSPAVTVGMLPTTPTTGDVEVTLPPFPTVTQTLLTPCAAP